jgi:4-hydroxymandelate synthase
MKTAGRRRPRSDLHRNHPVETTMAHDAFADRSDHLTINHVEFYVGDCAARAIDLIAEYGFHLLGQSGPDGAARSVALGQGEIRLVLTEGRHDEHPASTYVQLHGDGVADIALRTTDAAATFQRAVARGASPIAEPAAAGGCVTATISAFGDVVHTFVQPAAVPRPRSTSGVGSALAALASPTPAEAQLAQLDHFAVCLPAGQLAPTVAFYRSVLDFRKIYEEHIVVGQQAMNSEVVQSRSGGVTLTLIEPDTSREPGQIDEFVKEHGGAGVQHIAMSTDDIVRTVGSLCQRGVVFLTAPDAYYELLPRRLTPQAHTVDQLREHNILVDVDHYGQLFQIFTRSAHPRRTFFFEVIERRGARTFGSGNIKALYEAVELERTG